MKLSEFKTALKSTDDLHFRLPDGSVVPENFHITEVGKVQNDFIDCGGKVRNEKFVNFQLWDSVDFDHRLQASKLLDIIKISEEKLDLEDVEIEVEYQGTTIEKYALASGNGYFELVAKQTDCLAKDKCGIEDKPKIKVNMSDLQEGKTCTPGGGCC